MRTILVLLIVFIEMLGNVQWVEAAEGLWADNGAAVCTDIYNQKMPQLVSDGAGGAIITWTDDRNGNDDIYAQRINATGAIVWSADGVAICTNGDKQGTPQIAADGTGGAIITWGDNRNGNYDIYSQRINASGSVAWQTDGVAICTAGNDQKNNQLISDGAGGAIITWEDYRSGNTNIYSQCIDASGSVAWQTNGVAICTEGHYQWSPQLITDGMGGAIITWRDERNGNSDIYSQRINASGNVVWQIDGTTICAAAEYQGGSQIAADGTGGAIITWGDNRNGNYDIYSQRINASGSIVWQTDGVAICTAGENQWCRQIVGDGTGGAIITWDDERNGNYDIYSQRINASGGVEWQTDGAAICTDGENQFKHQIVADGAGGAIITWHVERTGNWDVYAQRINFSGSVVWQTDGVAICTAGYSQGYPQLTADGLGGAVIAWEDHRNVNGDIYGQRIIRLKPDITQINPQQAVSGEIVTTNVSGNNFSDDKGQVSFVKLAQNAQPDIIGYDINVDDESGFSCKFDLAGAALGDWYVIALDSVGQTSTGNVILAIMEKTPTLTCTPTITLTSTITPTLTVTPTPTITPTATRTNTITPTMTRTSTTTSTITTSPTITPTLTITPTPTMTLTLTITPTERPRFPDGCYAKPNPYCPVGGRKVKFITETNGPVKIWILDIKGRRVAVLDRLEWDGRSDTGHLCEGGVYIYQIEAEGKRVTGKVVLIK